jgi:hypothetical protein
MLSLSLNTYYEGRVGGSHTNAILDCTGPSEYRLGNVAQCVFWNYKELKFPSGLRNWWSQGESNRIDIIEVSRT